MVQQISALIVQPAVDASKYTAGASDKVAADRAMAESAKEAGAAQRGVSVVLTDTSAKLTVAGDVLARLSRTYVEGARQTQTFGRDLNALNRALETGKAGIADVANVIVGMQQKLGLAADASTLAAAGQTKLAAAVELANNNIRQQTTLLNEAAIAQARAAQQADNQRQIAAANQGKFNAVLGVGSASSNAAASAGVFTAEFDRLEQIALLRAQQIGALFQNELNQSFGIDASPLSAKSSAAVFEEAGREADQMAAKVAALRAQLDPLAAAQDRVNAEIAEYSTLAQRGMISAEEFAKAQAMARTRGGQGGGAARAAGFNAGQQIQDIAMMSMLGQAPMTLALQQGPQLATAIQQGGGLAALGAGLAAVFSTTTLLTVGFTAATAATVQWFMKGREGAKDLDEKLKGHSELLSRLKRQYGELGEAAKNLMPIGGAAYTEAQARSEIDTLRAAIRSQSGDLSKEFIGGGFLRGGLFGSNTGGLDTLLSTRNSPFQGAVDTLLKSVRDGSGGLEKFDANLNKIFDDLRKGADDSARLAEEMQRLSDAAIDAFAITGKMSPFQGEIDRLLLGLKEGNSDLSTFATNVRHIGELNGLGKQADDAILTAKEVVALAEKLREVEAIFNRIDRENTRPGLRDQRSLRSYVGQRSFEANELDRQFAADQQLARARTNAERLAAVEAQVRARAREDGDSGGGLQGRLSRALAEERTRQEVEARDATIQRSQAIERTLQQQRLELDLIGKTAGEQAKLRFEFERMQELREQAARTGDPIDEKEVAAIKAAGEAMKQYADAMASARLQQDLLFDIRQMGRSQADQSVASQLRAAGLPEDLDSDIAKVIRMRDEIARVKDAWQSVFDTANSGVDTLVDALFDGTTSIEDALKNIGKDFAKQMFDMSVTNPIKNWLTGANLNTIADLGIFGSGASSGKGGGLGGVLGGLLGAQKAVGSMQVQAASVIVNGSVLGGAGGIGAGLPNILGGTAANDNKAMPMALSGIGSPGSLNMAGASSSVSDISGYIRQAALARGIDPNIALRVARSEGLAEGVWQSNVFKNGIREPSYGPFQLLKGGQGTGFPSGLGNAFMKQTGLDPADPSTVKPQVDFALNHASKNGWGAWYGAKAAGVGNFDGLQGASTKASEALDKLATGSISTAESLAGGLGGLTGVTQSTMQALEQFGIGAGNLGSMLQNLMATGGGFGGNWFANLAGMFGGAGGALNHMNAISPMATAHILKGGVGLFANGAAFSGGNVIPFANGDVFSSPTYFQMGGGKTGLLGEAGPEAIMPLRRGPDGKLGVSAGTSQGQQNRGMSQGQVDAILNALKKLQMNAKIVNVFDPSIVGDYLRTDEGERLIMNVQRRNR